MINDPILGEVSEEKYRKDSQRLRIAMKQSWSERLREIEAKADAEFAEEKRRLDEKFNSLKPVAQPVIVQSAKQPVKEMEYVS